MSKNLTEEQRNNIVKLYKDGHSYSEIKQITGHTSSTISTYVKGTRTRKEAVRLHREKGKGLLSDKGREVLIKSGQALCIKNNKYYTKPEQCFKDLVESLGIGVKFPDYVKKTKNTEDTKGCSKYLLFQYPIQRYILDYVSIEHRVAININGDYWHANPLLYDKEHLGKVQKFNTIRDNNKRIFLEKRGWTVLDIWESEIYWNKELVINKLRAVGITEARLDYTQETEVQLLHGLPDWSDEIKKLWFPKKHEKKPAKMVICPTCNKAFKYTHNNRVFCSKECVNKHQARHIPPKEELVQLVGVIPMTKIGRIYGVSDNAVRNWCKKFKIPYRKCKKLKTM